MWHKRDLYCKNTSHDLQCRMKQQIVSTAAAIKSKLIYQLLLPTVKKLYVILNYLINSPDLKYNIIS